MRDRFFYPLFTALVLGGIYYALSFGEPDVVLTEAEIRQDGFVLQADELAYLTASPGTSFSLGVSDNAEKPVSHVTVEAHASKGNTQPSAGVFIVLDPEYAQAFSGKLLEVTIRARQASSDPAARFEAGYFVVNKQDSGWKDFELGPDYEDHIFYYTLQKQAAEPPTKKWVLPWSKSRTSTAPRHLIGIWPESKGRKRALDVEYIGVNIKG